MIILTKILSLKVLLNPFITEDDRGYNRIKLYFSFTTLTTFGYEDIVPQSMPAKMLSTLEAVTGQLYIAILLARLVGLCLAHSSRKV